MTEERTGPAAPEAPARTGGLRRGRGRKVIAGVCEGAGRYFDIDPVVFRVVLAVLALTGGVGLLVYGVVWLLVPAEGEEESEAHRLLSGRVEGPALTAVLVALVGCGLFLSMLGSTGNLTFSLTLLAALAGAVFWSQHRRRTAEEVPPAPQPPPTPGATPWWQETPPATGYLWGPDDGPYDKEEQRKVWRERRRTRRREGSWLGIVVFLLACMGAGVGTAAGWHSQPLGTSLETGLAVALAVFGAGFLLSTWYGRLGGGTVTAVVLTAALLVGAAALPKSIGTEWRKVTWRPTATGAISGAYRLGAGEAALDLRTLRPGKDRNVRTAAELGAGQLTVTVPRNAEVVVNFKVGIGDVRLPGDTGRDVDVQPNRSGSASFSPAGGSASAGTVTINVKVGVGQLRVIR